MSASAAHGGPFPRVTAPMLQAMKTSQRPIVMVTAYDTPSARLVDAAGVDAILVGDSLGMTVLGYDSTLPVTMDDMVQRDRRRLARRDARARRRRHAVHELPGQRRGGCPQRRAPGRRGRALTPSSSKAAPHRADAVRRIVDAGIPVMGHVGPHAAVGATPSAATRSRRSRPRRRCSCSTTPRAAGRRRVRGRARVHPRRARRARHRASCDIPTIGIGAGAGCDGQVQVFHDCSAWAGTSCRVTPSATPRSARRSARRSSAYADDVRDGAFPGDAQSTPHGPGCAFGGRRVSSDRIAKASRRR